MEIKLTEEMLKKVATDLYRNYEEFQIVGQLIWLYDNLAKHDKDFHQELIEKYEYLKEEENYLFRIHPYKVTFKDPREEK